MLTGNLIDAQKLVIVKDNSTVKYFEHMMRVNLHLADLHVYIFEQSNVEMVFPYRVTHHFSALKKTAK